MSHLRLFVFSFLVCSILTPAVAAQEPSCGGKPLSEWIKRLKSNSGLRYNEARQAILAIGPPAVPALVLALKDRSSDMRGRAAMMLGEIGPAAHEAMPALREALKDPEAYVRGHAARSLLDLGVSGKEAIPLWIAIVEGYGMWQQTRVEAAQSLAELGPEASAAVPTLIQALKDKGEGTRVRYAAARALGHIGPGAREAMPALQEALKDYPAVRGDAALALLVGPGFYDKKDAMKKDAIALYIAILKDAPSVVRDDQALALLDLGVSGKDAIPLWIAILKNGWMPERVKAAQSLGELGPEASAAVPTLIQALKDQDWQDWGLKKAAAIALGQMGPAARDAIPALREVLAAPGKSLGGTMTPQQVMETIRDQEFRIAVREALKKIEAN